MKKPKPTSSEWDLCPKCKRPWKFHTTKEVYNSDLMKYDGIEIICPKDKFQWRTKRKK